MELVKNLKRLPIEIVNKIWGYTYSPQPVVLMEDIRDYIESLDYICYYYFEKFSYEDSDYQYRLVYDMFCYISYFSSVSFHSYNDFWMRSIYCKNMDPDQLSEYIYRLEHNNIDAQIRLLWGLFYPKERAEFIDTIEYFIVSDSDDEDDYDDF